MLLLPPADAWFGGGRLREAYVEIRLVVSVGGAPRLTRHGSPKAAAKTKAACEAAAVTLTIC
jgi:hypothetical protein